MRILIVDDSVLLRALYSRYLTRMGYETREADQTDAEHMDWGRFDIVLLDVMMPRLSGYDLLRLASKSWSMQPRIFVYSVLTTRTAKQAFEDAGVDVYVTGYISKSIGMAKSLAFVEEAIGNPGRRAQHQSEQLVGTI